MFFTILTIIGKILLVILKILLSLFVFFVIIIGLVLFVPVRYQFEGNYYNSMAKGRAGVFWFLHVVSLRATIEGEKTSFVLRFFGIKILPRKEKNKRKLEKARKKTIDKTKLEKKKTDNKKQEPLVVNENLENTKENKISLQIKDLETGRIELNKNNDKKENNKTSKLKDILLKFISAIKNIPHFFEKIMAGIKNAVKTVKKMCAAIKEGKDKAVLVKEFVFSDESRNLICFVKNNVLHLWRHIRPQHVRANIILGFDDPALTGQVLGLIAVFCGMAGIMPNVIPDFERKIFEGEIEIKGRINMFVLLKILLKVYLSEEIKEFKKEYERIREVL